MKTNFIFSPAAPQRPLPSATQRSTTRHAFGVTLSTPSGIVRPYPQAQTVIRDSGKLFVYGQNQDLIGVHANAGDWKVKRYNG